jgi:hypothetical protein
METLPGPLLSANVLWHDPEAQVPSPGEPLEPAFPAEYSALLEVILVSPNASARIEMRTGMDFFIVVKNRLTKRDVKEFTSLL